MILLFQSMTMTFKHLNFWVQIPKDSYNHVVKDRDHLHMAGNR